jgi:hypothetical protein
MGDYYKASVRRNLADSLLVKQCVKKIDIMRDIWEHPNYQTSDTGFRNRFSKAAFGVKARRDARAFCPFAQRLVN